MAERVRIPSRVFRMGRKKLSVLCGDFHPRSLSRRSITITAHSIIYSPGIWLKSVPTNQPTNQYRNTMMSKLKSIAIAATLAAGTTIAIATIPAHCQAGGGVCGTCTTGSGTRGWWYASEARCVQCDGRVSLSAYQPPDNGGPTSTGGTGTR